MSKHRIHPRLRKSPGPGICLRCLDLILTKDGQIDKRRKFCSRYCRTFFELECDPALMRRHVFVRDEGVCARCGRKWLYMTPNWEADHVEPLKEAYDDARFWSPDNVVLLCRDPCHIDKTREDRARYGWGSKKPKKRHFRP